MEEKEILEKVSAVVSAVLKREVKLSPATAAADVDGWDSLSHMMIINGIEQKFSLRFKLKEVMAFGNAGDLVACIAGKLKE